jgi:hypothetical protein
MACFRDYNRVGAALLGPAVNPCACCHISPALDVFAFSTTNLAAEIAKLQIIKAVVAVLSAAVDPTCGHRPGAHQCGILESQANDAKA